MNGVLTLTPNPAVDETYQVALRPGETHRVRAPEVRAGGKGLNVARVVARAGRPVVAIAPVDELHLAQFGDQLRASGVTPELVQVTGPTRRSIALVDTAADQATVLNEYGVPISRAEWAKLDDCLKWSMAKYAPRVVVVSGSLPPDPPRNLFPEIIKYARASRARCIVDTSGPALLDAVAAGADLVKPNAEEVREATGESDLATAVRALLDRSPDEGARALVSAGPDGLALFTKGRRGALVARPPERLRGNPTGAGDAAVAAAAVALCSDWDDERLARTAVQWSSAAVLAPVAGELGPLTAPARIRVVEEN
ncbi:hexose kinase [Naumannella cuiyingiana]|uniref:Carbohydrate kinase PfkB domain-containing protein n=1 Tax=Naumannella cuiyingiana TaxID=1347891 RepID=A0A7Z0D7M8_9ACTN|nr:hypothetical protein [Naumannella cuiyingiana]